MSPSIRIMTFKFILAAMVALLPGWLAHAADSADQPSNPSPEQNYVTSEAYPPPRVTLQPVGAPPVVDTPAVSTMDLITSPPPIEPPVIGRVAPEPAEPTV